MSMVAGKGLAAPGLVAEALGGAAPQAEVFEDPMAETAFAALLFRRLARF